MSSFLSHLLPTLDSLGVWSYWLIALAAFLEGWWLTGVVVPGTLIVDAGGALVRLGHLDFFDLVWFVAAGAILGGEAGFLSGGWLGGRVRLPESRAFTRAQELLRRHGPVALVIGRFLGPVAGLAALAAALSGMERRRFHLWNAISGIVYALAHVGTGFVAGDILTRITPFLPRLVLPLGMVATLILVIWLVTRQARKGAPALLAGLEALRQHVIACPLLQRLSARHPRSAEFIGRRLDPAHGGGLLATGIALLLLYLVGIFVDGALDLALVPDTVALDGRVSNLAHAYWTPLGLSLAGWFTDSGHVPVATLVALGGVAGLALFGRRAAAAGLAVAVIGDAVTVALLKLAFARARPDLSYFLESSHSFPSGHAAISVALYGSLALLLWRERLIGPTLAITAGVGMAFGLGLTRIYLIEHYLSDVLNGWVIGTIWMVIGFATAEALRRRPARAVQPRPLLGAFAVAICVGAALWIAIRHQPDPVEQAQASPHVIADLPGEIARGAFPVEVVTLTGDRLPPVSTVSTGPSLSEIETRLIDAGWSPVPAPDLRSGLAALQQELTGTPRRGATAPFAFRLSQPAAVTLRAPEHEVVLRLWHAGEDATGAPLTAWAFAAEDARERPALAQIQAEALAPFAAEGVRLDPVRKAGTR